MKTQEFSDVCGKCVAAVLENGERTDPSQWMEKLKTRADRIRAMSDEELAKCLLTVDDDCKYCKNLPECDKLLDTPEGIPEGKCLGCLVEWLREPEGEQHERS
jgi:hypothetical protein